MPPLTGKPRPTRGRQITRGQGEELLIGVEPPTMFGREHATDGRGLDCAEEETGEREREQLIQVATTQSPESRVRVIPAELRLATSRRARPD